MLSILDFVVIMIATIFAYRIARKNGRNGIAWGLINFAVGFGTQIVIPLLIGIILGIVWVSKGTPPDQLQAKIEEAAMLIGITTIIISFIGMGLVLRYVSRIPDDDAHSLPPPPSFGS